MYRAADFKGIWIDFGLNNEQKDFVTCCFPQVNYFDNDSNCEQS